MNEGMLYIHGLNALVGKLGHLSEKFESGFILSAKDEGQSSLRPRTIVNPSTFL